MTEATDDTFRGVALGAMFMVAIGSMFVVFVGALVEAESTSGANGNVLMIAGIAGAVTAAIVGRGVVRDASVQTAAAAAIQAIVAALVFGWWVVTDAWSGTAHASLSTVLLGVVIALDTAIALWAVLRVRHRSRV